MIFSPCVCCQGHVAQVEHYADAEYIFTFVERGGGVFYVCVPPSYTPHREHLRHCLQHLVKEIPAVCYLLLRTTS